MPELLLLAVPPVFIASQKLSTSHRLQAEVPAARADRAVYAVGRDGNPLAYVNFPFLRCPLVEADRSRNRWNAHGSVLSRFFPLVWGHGNGAERGTERRGINSTSRNCRQWRARESFSNKLCEERREWRDVLADAGFF